MLNGDSGEITTSGWRTELADRMEEIFARKGSTVQGREKCFKTYAHLLTAQYAEEEIRGKEGELIATFLKSIKEERSEREAILASKGRHSSDHNCGGHADMEPSYRHNPHYLPLGYYI